MKTRDFCNILKNSVNFFVILILVDRLDIAYAKKTENEEKCIWFDECGPDPTPGRGSKTLNCAYNGEPGTSRKFLISFI